MIARSLELSPDVFFKLTPCRLAIIYDIQTFDHPTIASIARWRGRHHKNVSDDVRFLEAAGIIAFDGKKWDICASKLTCKI